MLASIRTLMIISNVCVLLVCAYLWGEQSGKSETRAHYETVIDDLSEHIILATAPALSVLAGPPSDLTADSKAPSFALYDDAHLCLAFNIYHEARDQPREGRVMVGQVTMNRTGTRKAWATICKTVFAAWQFSWTEERPYVDLSDPIEREALRDALILSERLLNGEERDRSEGSRHYYNPEKATPFWRDSYDRIAVIGDHIFLK